MYTLYMYAEVSLVLCTCNGLHCIVKRQYYESLWCFGLDMAVDIVDYAIHLTYVVVMACRENYYREFRCNEIIDET